jgi:deoxyribodipyrimidine photo-lyase
MKSPRRLVIHWFRRDLRLSDNIALHQASLDGSEVLPVYVVSDWKDSHLWTGPNRQQFLCAALESLAHELAAAGGELVFRTGAADHALERLIQESGADALYFNRDPDPFGVAMETKVEAICRVAGVECRSFRDVALHGPDEVVTKTGGPYRVFTPYSRNWLSLDKPEIVPKFNEAALSKKRVRSDAAPTLDHWRLKEPDAEILKAGERAAQNRLREFLEAGIGDYSETRDLPALCGTSRLSQDLRFGLISPRTAYHQAMAVHAATRSAKAKKNIEVFIKELAWREFYMSVLHHFPQILEHEFNPDWRGLPWDEPGEKFDAWRTGKTGFPIVDAGIRQLLRTGFMHNRVRMIVAMFLTKDLHIDWRLGEQFFMQHLVDGEIASNNGGWQWSAGTGADAAPYFRIQNPWSQTKRYDPEGEYIKRWLPELQDVAPKRFLEAPRDGKPLAEGYPLPCVDHHRERERTLAIFKKHRAKKR